MKMQIGSLYLGKAHESDIKTVTLLTDNDHVITRTDFNGEITSNTLQPFCEYFADITQLTIGYTHLSNLNFLNHLPMLEKVDIMTSLIKDISGLQKLPRIRELSLERPAYSLDVLGELFTLESIFLGDWRAGAKSIFKLKQLMKISVKKFRGANLHDISHWQLLQEAWFDAGKLSTLDGAPKSLGHLRLTRLKNLYSLEGLSLCPDLEDLRLENCKGIHNLQGIERCYKLKTLSISKGGIIESLQPLQNLKDLEYVLLGGGTQINMEDNSLQILYDLPNLKRIIISQLTGIEKERILQRSPFCQVVLTK
jgi:hypothetical protein